MAKGNNGLLGLKRGPYKPQKNKSPRKVAKETGLLHYMTGKPCINSHISKRLVSDGSCVECAPIKRLKLKTANPEKFISTQRNWRAKNPEKQKAYRKKYQANSKTREVKRIAQLRRHARYMNAEGSFTKDDIDRLKILQNFKCCICGCDLAVTGYNIEHKVPLIRGGSNWPENLQLMCPSDNFRKHTKTDEEYRTYLGLIQ